ncbi:uncharacterized protein METZ01_LOCUS204121, partial [marine metagenome]
MHTKRFLWVALAITLVTSTQAKD